MFAGVVACEMREFRSTVLEIIDQGETTSPIDIYAVAEALHGSFPEKKLEDLAAVVAEVAVHRSGRCVVWERWRR